MYNHLDTDTTIIAPATAAGGAVMVVRLSGSRAIEIADSIFHGKKPCDQSLFICMTGKTIQSFDPCFYLNGFTKQFYILCSLE